MWKKTIVGTAALLFAGSMMVYAQQGQEPAKTAAENGGIVDTGIAELHGELKPNAEDMAAFSDARMAALHAALKLNVDQEKVWPAFEEALRDLAKMRTIRTSAMRDQQPFSDPVQQLRRQADALALRRSALIHLADTLEPLYQSFDEGQKHRFAKLARFIRPYPYSGMGRAEANGRGVLDAYPRR